MSDWFDKAMEALERDYYEGCISYADFQEEYKLLRQELKAEAEEAAQDVYEQTMGYKY